ncbi:maltose alpha-D-glucosyltransferase [Tunturibacter empetritectus]|uniref:Maltokinase n=1 Tax=Tunturiibacter empetritectus TaxID=3069691 RepID=A0A7W8II07_9BACT|nr:maltose alpha-D-glucosyltransferase [Edaphobacter lichenicola]MBB5317482.1 maltose alpha-D-glucosyltransferase/alpha-amylase [Edaphobacter lichenicola]
MKKISSTTDPLWYKDAIIYEIHVRAFMDSNADGIGDFPGLMSKLDYLQDLGVTCLWLLPFFPSPLRDDGYDIANYVDVNPSYGTLNDFKQFLDAAHLRNMQVMIELVINHTSDQHPWFKAARLAPKGSPEREMYVWSDTDKLFEGVRIIFTDTEKSNWTWDDVAQQYYWHRFFSHQPDLNFDNPRVMEEVLTAMRFWLDMGVDGLRLDAIPYLIERDGTSCENVPETHVKIKQIRAVIDAEYENRLVLAEANMWPADVRPYFGDGDECNMAFHFPLMPRIYMALRQEDRLPITDIMAQTPAIPDNCQWGLFLRNHDELTLEMVTDDERDYMYFAYSADPRMRINVGIRRRLAPLVDNNRRRIELLNSLLLSFPGTPILYYGDEIGMGDNIYLGDRNGVRTPMQWNSDRNAGFSTSIPARLYFPVITDPIWGYQSINVEAQQSDQSSLLHWTRNMIALRKLFHVFGRGTQEFLNPENRKILAYIRQYEENGNNETVLCVANLSRFSQPVSLDLSKFSGMIPVEMLGYVNFPTITAQPYPLTLSPYSFLWLELQAAPAAPEPVEVPVDEPIVNLLSRGVEGVLTGDGLALLERLLTTYLPHQRWFGAKSRTIKAIDVLDSVMLSTLNAVLLLLHLTYEDNSTDVYQLALTTSTGEAAEMIRAADPASIVATVTTSDGPAVLHDALAREDVRQAILRLIETNGELSTRNGSLQGRSSSAFAEARGTDPLPARTGSAEQSNTSILYDAKLILKLFRRLQPGENPDTEIGRFLTETARFPRIAPFLGDITLHSKTGEPTTTAMLQGLVENESDGWQWTLDELSHYYDSVAILPALHDLGTPPSFLSNNEIPALAREHAGLYLDAAALLGRRTAEMHLALATPTHDPAFMAEDFTTADLVADADRIDAQLSLTLDALKRGMSHLTEITADNAALVLSRRIGLFARARAIASATPTQAGQRIRIHGDYHLGQVLRSRSDYVILDFEGEPARSLTERRAKQSPLRDVAGMLRSFSYAAHAAHNAFAQRRPDDAKYLEPWSTLWQNSVSTEFLRAYHATVMAKDPELIPKAKQAQLLLSAYLLEKSLYELLYELNNRPAWVRIPLAGILSLQL